MLSKLTFPPEDIESILAPGLMRRYPAEGPAWDAYLKAHRRELYVRFFKQRFHNVISGPTKSVENVRGSYNQAWAQEMYPGSPSVEQATQVLHWRRTAFEVRGWTEKRIHLWMFLRAMRVLQPKSVLEVGCGNGAMLMMLNVMYPAETVAGIDLTEQGIAAAERMQQTKRLREAMVDFLPAPMRDADAFRKIRFQQANAASIPFENGSFDVTITSLALEQMDRVKEQVLREIHRVTRRFVIMIEPFPDYNLTRERRLYTRANSYFSVPVADLPRFGLEPVLTFHDFPSKVVRGTGLVVAEIASPVSAQAPQARAPGQNP